MPRLLQPAYFTLQQYHKRSINHEVSEIVIFSNPRYFISLSFWHAHKHVAEAAVFPMYTDFRTQKSYAVICSSHF
jgi:hypothetical protein